MHDGHPFSALVVGGSVGGLAVAHELRSIGAEVAVYERSADRTQPRGAGIVMQPEVEALLGRLGISVPSVSVQLHERQQLHPHGEATRFEAPQWMTAWDTLYYALREPLADLCYRLDSALADVHVEGQDVTAMFADGYLARGNLLVGADGIGSTTRALLNSPEDMPYAGSIACRGLEPESAVPDDLLELVSQRFTYFGAPGMQMLCYLVPGPGGERERGSRRGNWVWYGHGTKRCPRSSPPSCDCRMCSCSRYSTSRLPGWSPTTSSYWATPREPSAPTPRREHRKHSATQPVSHRPSTAGHHPTSCPHGI